MDILQATYVPIGVSLESRPGAGRGSPSIFHRSLVARSERHGKVLKLESGKIQRYVVCKYIRIGMYLNIGLIKGA